MSQPEQPSASSASASVGAAAESTPPSASPAPAPAPLPSPSSASPGAAASLSRAAELKAAGNALFTAGQYERAVAKWTKVFAYTAGLSLGSDSAAAGIIAMTGNTAAAPALADEQQRTVDELTVSTNANLAMAYLKLNDVGRALYFANKADNTKALFRRGCAYRLQGRLDDSKADLSRAAELAPNDAAIRAELKKLKDSEKAADLKERQHYAGMFDNKASNAH